MEDVDIEERDVPIEETGAPEQANGGAAATVLAGIERRLHGEDPPAEEGPSSEEGRATTGPSVRDVVEAALFSAGDPVEADQIAEATGIDADDVRDALEDLVETYGERATALEVARAGRKYTMQIRSDLTEQTRRLAPQEIPRHLLRTLALIAYHQPIKQSDMVDMIGSKTYDHVGQLEELGMIRAEPHKLTKKLTTTDAFAEYFGIDATDREGIRSWLEQKVGLTAPRGSGASAPAAEEE